MERTIALIDGHPSVRAPGQARFEVLDHPWLTEDRLKRLKDIDRTQLQVDRDLAQKLERLQHRVDAVSPAGQTADLEDLDRSLSYIDPIGKLDPEHYGGTWLAAFWPVGHTEWVAIVQERRSTAKHPVDDMEQRLWQYMRLGLMVCCALIGALWYFIFRMLSDRNRTGM